MNSYDIFKKLTKGIKFDRKNYGKDLQRLGIISHSKQKSSIPYIKSEPEAAIKQQSYDGLSENEEMHSDEANLHSVEELDIKDEEGEILHQCPKKIKLLDYVEVKQEKKKKTKKLTKDKQMLIKLEEINHFRNLNKISIWGSDIPEPISTFEKLKISYGINDTLMNNWCRQGYTKPTPIQMQAWPLMLQQRELLACAPTGSGKTAAFLVPIIHQLQRPQKKGFRAVILAPTRELAKQTFRECVRLCDGIGLKTHFINNIHIALEKFGSKSSKRFDILVTTPNRLVYLLTSEASIDLSNVEWLIIDESDRLFESGTRGFRDQLAVIYQACSSSRIKRALYSATFAHEVEHWCKLNLNNVAMISIGVRNSANCDVKQELRFCGDEMGKIYVLREIFKNGYKPPVLIFVQTKERARQLFKELIYDDIMVDVIHAERTQIQRDKVVKAFRDRKIWVLICTELMARGIDFKGVNLVINYDFPPSTVSYIHRIGRTGRAHKKGYAITFWTMEDKPLLPHVAYIIKSSDGHVPQWMLQMKKLTSKEKKQRKQPERGYVSKAVQQEYTFKRLQKKERKRETRVSSVAEKDDENPVSRENEDDLTNNSENVVEAK